MMQVVFQGSVGRGGTSQYAREASPFLMPTPRVVVGEAQDLCCEGWFVRFPIPTVRHCVIPQVLSKDIPASVICQAVK